MGWIRFYVQYVGGKVGNNNLQSNYANVCATSCGDEFYLQKDKRYFRSCILCMRSRWNCFRSSSVKIGFILISSYSFSSTSSVLSLQKFPRFFSYFNFIRVLNHLGCEKIDERWLRKLMKVGWLRCLGVLQVTK